MRVALLLAAVVIASFCSCVREAYGAPSTKIDGAQLEQDIEAFLTSLREILPREQIMVIFLEHLERDPTLAASVTYLRSKDFRSRLEALEQSPAFVQYMEFFEDKGVPAHKWLERFHELLFDENQQSPGLDPTTLVVEPKPEVATSNKNLLTLIDEIFSILPLQEIIDMYRHFKETSSDFRALLSLRDTPEYQALRSALIESDLYQKLRTDLLAHDLDVRAAIERVLQYFKPAL